MKMTKETKGITPLDDEKAKIDVLFWRAFKPMQGFPKLNNRRLSLVK